MSIDSGKRHTEIYADEKLKLERAERQAVEKIKEAQEERNKGGITPPDQIIRQSVTGHKVPLKPSQIHEMAEKSATVQILNEQKAQKMGLGPASQKNQALKKKRVMAPKGHGKGHGGGHEVD